MENLNRKPMATQTKVLAGIVITIILLAGLLTAFKATNSWFNSHYFEFANPVEVKLNQPISIKERKPETKYVYPARPEEVHTPIKEYACKLFGDFNCLTMIAIFQAESGWNNEAWHYNTNHSLDFGIGQINSINWKLPGCSMKEISTEKGNIDCAYLIWDRADGVVGNNKGSFTPWVGFTNSSYLSNL